MAFRTYIPQPPLSEFVELFWLSEGAPLTHSKERLLPTGTMELVINLRKDPLRVYESQNPEHFEGFQGAVVCGAHSEFFVIDSAQQASLVGVHFKPGGAFPFFGLPANELQNMHAGLESLWGAQAAVIREQLLEAGTAEARFCILERAFRARVHGPLARHPAVAFALKEFQDEPSRRMSSVTGQIGLSTRRFIQIFSEEVGLPPKQFCRIQRFQSVLRRVRDRPQIDWADLALACGYFDQAHFIHDFRAFCGLSPTSYLAQRGEHFNHVPILE
jgi:AraC-like DNA-binding protein